MLLLWNGRDRKQQKREWEREQEHTYFYMCVKDFLLFSTLSSMTKAATQKFHFTPRLWWNNIFITINLIEIFKKITLSKLKCWKITLPSLLTSNGIIQGHFIPNNKISFDNHTPAAFNKTQSLPIPSALYYSVQANAKYFHLHITSVYYLCFINFLRKHKSQVSKGVHRTWPTKTYITFLQLWTVPGTTPPQPPGTALMQIWAPSALPQMQVVRKDFSNGDLGWALTQGCRKLKTLFLWSILMVFSCVITGYQVCFYMWHLNSSHLNVLYPYIKVRRGCTAW